MGTTLHVKYFRVLLLSEQVITIRAMQYHE